LLIALIGFTGAGKSTLGRMIGKAHGLPIFDVDRLIELQEKCSVAELFVRQGETEFRSLERQIIAGLVSSYATGVIVTGGGAVTAESTRMLLYEKCFTVHVQATLAEIWQRLQGDTERPLLQGDDPKRRLEQLFEERTGLYKLAHLQLDACDVKVSASQVVANWLCFMRRGCTV